MSGAEVDKPPPVFAAEEKLLERCEQLLDEELTAEELRHHFHDLTRGFGKLLRQTGKITRIGDSIQRRLFKARQEIESKNRELVNAQKKLVLKEKMLGLHIMVSGVAHELRNPLNFINNLSAIHTEIAREIRQRFLAGKPLGEAEIAEIIEDLDQLAEGAELIHGHGIRADNIIEQMQRITRDPSRPHAADLNLLLTGYLTRVRNSQAEACPLHGLKIIEELDPELGEMVIEAGDLGFVFTQVLTNAMEAMQERLRLEPAFLAVLVLHSEYRDEKIFIRFRDNGIGVTPEHASEIFNPFFTTKPTGGGNIGLGLFTSYDILTGYGGEITHSRKDGFTEFCVSLPCPKK